MTDLEKRQLIGQIVGGLVSSHFQQSEWNSSQWDGYVSRAIAIAKEIDRQLKISGAW